VAGLLRRDDVAAGVEVREDTPKDDEPLINDGLWRRVAVREGQVNDGNALTLERRRRIRRLACTADNRDVFLAENLEIGGEDRVCGRVHDQETHTQGLDE